jgi:hypothetical protein
MTKENLRKLFVFVLKFSVLLFSKMKKVLRDFLENVGEMCVDLWKVKYQGRRRKRFKMV